jgi:hypothetical protein
VDSQQSNRLAVPGAVYAFALKGPDSLPERSYSVAVYSFSCAVSGIGPAADDPVFRPFPLIPYHQNSPSSGSGPSGRRFKGVPKPQVKSDSLPEGRKLGRVFGPGRVRRTKPGLRVPASTERARALRAVGAEEASWR